MKKTNFFASLKSMKKEVGSGVGSGSAPKCHGSPQLLIIVKNGTRAWGGRGEWVLTTRIFRT
jgi:hypothetical protein